MLLLLFSHYVVSNSLWRRELQHARLLCPSLSPWVSSNSCPLSQRCHTAISLSATPVSSCPQCLPSLPFPSPRSPRGSQESSTAPFESINSALSLHYGPTLTSVRDYWDNHSFDYTDLCQQSDVSAFQNNV